MKPLALRRGWSLGSVDHPTIQTQEVVLLPLVVLPWFVPKEGPFPIEGYPK